MVSTNLIIGYGYLGCSLLRLLNGQQNFVTNRSQTNVVGGDNRPRSLILNINEKETWESLELLSEAQDIRIYFMVPPRQIDRAIFSNFIERLNKLNISSATLVSSTVVYGNKDRIVDADSEVHIDSERAERQYLIEHDWLAAINNGAIVRLAGIYGPERIIGKFGITNGDTVHGDPDGWLNLIHVDDGASLLKRVSELQTPDLIELGCDGNPTKRHDYYSFLAQTLKKAPPKFNQDESTRGTGRRCDNQITITRTGWKPAHTDFREVLTSLIR